MKVITRTLEPLILALFLAVAGFAVAGCEPDGPFERAGERVDDAADDVGDAIEDAGDEIEDALE